MRSTRNIKITALLTVFLMTGCSERQVYRTSANPNPISCDSININTASVDELKMLPYIGRKTAEAIVQFRTENGPFRRPEHLMQVRGISETRFIELRPILRTE